MSAQEAPAVACSCAWPTSCFGAGHRDCIVDVTTGARCTCACGCRRTCHGCDDCARPVDAASPHNPPREPRS